MRILLVSVAIISVSLAKIDWTAMDDICGMSSSDRIIGGTAAKIGQFPWIAHIGILRRDGGNATLSYECGGTLIHPRFVVSAAHCSVGLGPGERIATVKLGEHNLETKIDCDGSHCADPPQVIYPLRIVAPKEYDEKTLKHDLIVIELSEPANITDFVAPVCLPRDELLKDEMIGEIVEIAGWGYFDIDDPKASPILQVVRLPIVELENCKKITQLSHYNFTKGNQICVGGVAGKDSCNGDSGGPLIRAVSYGEHGPRYVLFGIVSVGLPSCGKFSLPAVYTNVSHYLPWIFEVAEGK